MQLAFKLPDVDADAARHAQNLSAWMDEDTDADCPQAYLISDAGRATWDTYHLIGDVLRTPDLAIAPTPAFSLRMAEAMVAEPCHETTAAPAGMWFRPAWPRLTWPSLALAAALALVAWMARPFFVETDVAAPVLADAQHENTHQNERQSAAVAGLNNYLDAHRQLVGPSVVRQVSFGGAGARASVVRTGAGR